MRSKEDTVHSGQAAAPKPGRSLQFSFCYLFPLLLAKLTTIFLVEVTGDPLATPYAAFILIGKTGVGKSNFVKLLGGRAEGKEPIVGEGIDSCKMPIAVPIFDFSKQLTRKLGTEKPTTYYTKINNREIILLDTPGFDDSGTENLDILADIISNLWVFALRKDEIKTHGVIFLHDISEVRFSGSQRKTLSILKALCGDECMGNVIIGTTKWSPEKPAKFKKEEEREQRFLKEHWGGIYKTTRLPEEDGRDAAVQVITDLLAKDPVLFRAQREMLRPPHKVENTTAVKLVIPEAQLERDQLYKEIKEQKERFEEEQAKNDKKINKLEQELAKREKMLGDNSEKDKELEELQRTIDELKEQRRLDEEENAKRSEKQEKERGFFDDIFEKLKSVPDMTFAEKFGLAIAAPIILAPAALVAAPVGVIAAFVGLANHFTKPHQQPT